MTGSSRVRGRRTAFGLAVLAAIWTAVIAFSGGLSVTLAGVRFSSHAVLNPALLAFAAAAVAVLLARPTYRESLVDDLRAAIGAARRVSPATYILFVGIAARLFYWLLAPPLWLDEEMVAINLRGRTLTGLAGELWLGQAAPLGWMVTERLLGLAFGFGELALRAVPTVFGVATVVAAWWAGRRWLSAAGAAAFVFLAAVGEWMFHFSIELKHYSADTFFGLLLPVLVVWALEGQDKRERLRRASIWWIAAIGGQLWSMGGLLVAPVCVIVLVVMLWRRDGFRSASIASAVGVAWLAVFGFHYAATLRFAAGSPFLQATWSNRMAPQAAGLVDRLAWVAQQAAPLALNPAGTALSLLFWAMVVCGCVAARPRVLGAVLAAVPLFAVLLGIARITPLYERFTIWALPAVYFAVAFALDAGLRWARTRASSAPTARVAGVALAVGAMVICVNVGIHGYSGIVGTHHGATNHALDDRSAVEWLVREGRPGDAVFTTHLGAPAVWWYSRAPLADPAHATVFDGLPMFELTYHSPNPRCDPSAFEHALAHRTRALIYLGFEDLPEGAKDEVLGLFREVGTFTNLRVFGKLSIAGIVELAPAADRAPSTSDSSRLQRPCFSTEPATRW